MNENSEESNEPDKLRGSKKLKADLIFSCLKEYDTYIKWLKHMRQFSK